MEARSDKTSQFGAGYGHCIFTYERICNMDFLFSRVWGKKKKNDWLRL